jgi:hypothetical protein
MIRLILPDPTPMEPTFCRNCGNEIAQRWRGPRWLWLHVNGWQGQRCPCALSGAVPGGVSHPTPMELCDVCGEVTDTPPICKACDERQNRD